METFVFFMLFILTGFMILLFLTLATISKFSVFFNSSSIMAVIYISFLASIFMTSVKYNKDAKKSEVQVARTETRIDTVERVIKYNVIDTGKYHSVYVLTPVDTFYIKLSKMK